MNAVFNTSDYRRLWLSSAMSAVSIGGDYVLLGWYAFSISGNAAWVGMAFAVYYIPMLLLGVPAGSIADRFGRFRLMRALELGAGFSLVILAVAFWGLEQSYLHIFLLPILLGSVRAMYFPTRLSYAYDLTSSKQALASLAGINVAARIGMIPGSLAVGMLANNFGAFYAFLFMAGASFTAYLILGNKPPVNSNQVVDPAPIMENLRSSLREVQRNHILLVLILITAAVELFGVSFVTVLPSLEQVRLGIGVEALGWMNAAQSAGGLVTGLIMFVLPGKKQYAKAFFCTIAMLGLSVFLLGAVTGLFAILLVLAIVSGMIVVWDILTQSMMQNAVPEHLRGRAMGAWVLAIGSAPLGHLEIGFLATLLGVNQALYLNGVAVIAVVLLFLVAVPALRKL